MRSTTGATRTRAGCSASPRPPHQHGPQERASDTDHPCIKRYARREPVKRHAESSLLSDGNSLPFADPLPERQQPVLKRQIQPTARWPPGKRHCPLQRRSSCSVARNSAPDLEPVRAAARVGNAQLERCAASQAIPVAVLCCCTLGLAVRIIPLTCGAKGTRTPDPLRANNRQHVHPRPSPQVTVPQRVSASLQIRTCCGTFLLYSSPWVRGGQTPQASLCSLPGEAPSGRW